MQTEADLSASSLINGKLTYAQQPSQCREDVAGQAKSARATWPCGTLLFDEHSL